MSGATRRYRIAACVLGSYAPRARAFWRRARRASPWEPNQSLRATRRFARRHGLVVQAGPFAGLRFSGNAVGTTTLGPKLLGTYELELHAPLMDVISRSYDAAVNIGAGDGYYAVGLAARIDQLRVVAVDIDPGARRLCAETAALNAVADRVEILPHVTTAGLERMLTGIRSLVICDCEGCEVTLLDPRAVPSLANADLLVELHPFIDPAAHELPDRFRNTHEIELFGEQFRDPRAYSQRFDLGRTEAGALMDEGRPKPMQWAWMRTRASCDSP
jgi:predicted O-methyltransferase YrrM